jgi:hypothetical protein
LEGFGRKAVFDSDLASRSSGQQLRHRSAFFPDNQLIGNGSACSVRATHASLDAATEAAGTRDRCLTPAPCQRRGHARLFARQSVLEGRVVHEGFLSGKVVKRGRDDKRVFIKEATPKR